MIRFTEATSLHVESVQKIRSNNNSYIVEEMLHFTFQRWFSRTKSACFTSYWNLTSWRVLSHLIAPVNSIYVTSNILALNFHGNLLKRSKNLLISSSKNSVFDFIHGEILCVESTRTFYNVHIKWPIFKC